MKLSRRSLLRGAGAAIAASALPPLSRPLFAQTALDTAFAFTDAERETLRAVANRIVPPFRNDVFGVTEPAFLGAGEAGAVDYVEKLLAAFNPDVPGNPRIYPAGGEGGSTGDERNECHGGHVTVPDGWLELPPEKEVGWRAAIGRFQGGYRRGLAQLDEDAETLLGSSFVELRPVLQTALLTAWDGTNPLPRLGLVYTAGGGEAALQPAYGFGGDDRTAFMLLAVTHTIESLYGDPIYGGNRNRIGWKLVAFGGPRHPDRYYPEELETRGDCNLGYPFNFGFVENL